MRHRAPFDGAGALQGAKQKSTDGEAETQATVIIIFRRGE